MAPDAPAKPVDAAESANAVQSSERDRLRGYVFGLTVACPYEQDNPSDCPLCPVRQRTLPERLAWVNELTEKQLINILQYHEFCLRSRQAGLRP
jgi:hypothetical protein